MKTQKLNNDNIMLALSQPRLAAYHGELLTKNLAVHTLNTLLSQSLYPLLQLAELGLRNNLDAVFKRHWGDSWLNRKNIFRNKEHQNIEKAKTALTKRRKRIQHNRIIAELHFGFWVALLDDHYDQSLWPKLLLQVFPNLPDELKDRKYISKRFKLLQELRNRICHHKKIYRKDLAKKHEEIHEVIKWLNLDLHQVALKLDRFPEFYHNRDNVVRDLQEFYK